jgi:quercetin dioxygenase-like cupin family protein
MDAALVSFVPWGEQAPPTESVVRRRFEAEGLRVDCWSNRGGDYYDAHAHAFHKVLHVLSGDITFSLPELGQEFTLRPGDRLELSPGVLHHAFVGPDGVACLEGKRLS